MFKEYQIINVIIIMLKITSLNAVVNMSAFNTNGNELREIIHLCVIKNFIYQVSEIQDSKQQ